ncbi:hypothetical protein EXIGLDRAFT_744414 [Exidia glandulosa HHB12029]|uniref:Uncharacterized protein n=1 Tax=Exidia glandulosa HHB12029 TaxID=1314781 RepID=A0A165Q173_EXIGL|nr:hypothetical protein EXIGLDRAFT_744414 [Exidia glandulosa HHB12029]
MASSVRNYSRPLQTASSPLDAPFRPPRSPLRPTHSLEAAAGSSLLHRRRTKSTGPATAQRPSFAAMHQAQVPAHRRQRTLSTGAAPDFLRGQEFSPLASQSRDSRVFDDNDSGRSSPSSPTTFIAPAEFVARGHPRDSVLTQDSGITESSMYPSTLSGDDSPGSQKSPRIASFNDMSFNTLDSDDVSYRLDLLVRNHYFLPPAHSKPSVSELSLLAVDAAPKKSPLLKPISPNFRDFFRKAKPQTAPPSPEVARSRPVVPAPSRVPAVAAPLAAPPVEHHVSRAPTPRIAVLRERLDDLQQAAQDAEREMRMRAETPSGSAARRALQFDDVDPTDQVDLPEYLEPIEDVGPLTPSSVAFSEEDIWRRGLLEQAVGLSFNAGGYVSAPEPPVPGPSNPNTRSKRDLGQRVVVNGTVPTLRGSGDKRNPSRRPKSTSPNGRAKRPSNEVPSNYGTRNVSGGNLRPSHDARRPSTASVRSQPTPSTSSPLSANGLIASPIISPSEASQFSTVRSRPAAPTPSRALSQDPFPPFQHLQTMSQHVDFDYHPDTPPTYFTPLTPAPPRKPPTLGSGRSRGSSKASSTMMEVRRAASTPVLREMHTVVEIAPPPAFVVEDPSGARAPVSLPTMSTIGSMTSGSHYSDEEEVADAGPPGLSWRSPAFDANVRDSYMTDPLARESLGRDSFDGRQSLDARGSFDHRPSLDGRPSLTISIHSRPDSRHSLHSSTFGEPHRTSGERTLGRASTSTLGSVRHPHEVPPLPSLSSHLSAAPPVPAPGSAGPAFFDEVQDRFLSQESSSESETDQEDEELVHLGSPMQHHPGTRSSSRAGTPSAPPPAAANRMPWREPVSHMAEGSAVVSPGGATLDLGARRASESSQAQRGWHGTRRHDKGLEMLQRAQAGSAVSLGTRSTRSLREELTERDVADRRLEGLLVQHMEEERDRMKRIASGLAATQQG